jgi:sugar fermentation stimulation protein A
MPAPPIYRFPLPLKEGIIISRPNRFIMHVRAGRKMLVCHCPTTGRLGDLVLEGLPCLYSTSRNNKRKTGYTVEAISTSKAENKSWIGINQTAANRYVEYFLNNAALSKMAVGELRREVRLGRSRIDFLVGNAYVEVKTPLIMLPAPEPSKRERKNKFDSFERLIKHLDELRKATRSGKRAIMILCYLYDAKPFRAPQKDRTNSGILAMSRAAEQAGVERWQVNLRIERDYVSLTRYFNLQGGESQTTASPGPRIGQVLRNLDSAKG